MPNISRRAALRLGTAGAVGTVLATGGTAYGVTAAGRDPKTVAAMVKASYDGAVAACGGSWHSYISVANTDGTLEKAIDADSATVVEAYSVNKLAVATAVLDKVDKGNLTLDTKVDVTADIVIADGDGIFRLDGAYPSNITVGHALAALLTISDDTAVRLCGLVCTSAEINDTMVAKGFPHTQVVPVSNPHRFYLGKTTPKEMHDLLQALVTGKLLSEKSTAYLLNIIRSPIAFTDGIRLNMSTDERLNIATKAGWLDNGRNEAGIIFNASGQAAITYSLFATKDGDDTNFGPTHPLIHARTVMGRQFYDALYGSDAGTNAMPRLKRHPAFRYRPSNGG
ncbi:serine hydrolase [Fodinicola acaciae]|uniref:serine hydrolase n=1 Tax=Fodinicola acaciae TaxID=2681555 RepID=UPI0013D6227B|nr:serine hydrolase [Fodinicola acaciae]